MGWKKKINVIEVSAKNRINVDEPFQKIVDLILNNKKEEEILEKFGVKNANDISLSKNNVKKKEGYCCGR